MNVTTATSEKGIAAEPTDHYSYHREPYFVGGAKYVRCDHCGAESVPPSPDEVLHYDGCPLRADYRV